MIQRLCLLLCMGFLMSMNALYASHVMGAELRYECIGPGTCTYRVYHHVFFDCSGAATQLYIPISANPGNAPITNPIDVVSLNGSCPITPVQVNLSYAEVTPVCPGPGGISQSMCDTPSTNLVSGIAEAIWTYDLNLCGLPCTEFAISYSQCCRNGAINSLSFPAGDGTFVGSQTINTALTGCNNSPVFGDMSTASTIPEAFICAGQQSVLDYSGVDPDGDSLVYNLVDCLDTQSGGISFPVSYNTGAGYTGATPMGPDWQVSLNPSTGRLTVTPNPTGPALTAVICIEVSEYRNGVLINQTVRDLQVEAVACGGNAAPQPNGIGVITGGSSNGLDTIFTAPGATLTFFSKWTDINPSDSLFLESIPSNTLPSATVSTGNAGDSIAISWAVPAGAGGQTIFLPIQVGDDGCLHPLGSVQDVVIMVNEIGLSAVITDSDCNASNGGIDLTVLGGTPPFTFAWSNGASTEDLSGISGGLYSVTITDFIGNSISDSFFVNDGAIQLNASLVQPDCDLSNGGISLAPTGGTAPYTYQWSTSDSGSMVAGLGIGGYSVVVTDSNGCFTQELFELSYDDSCRATLSGIAYFDSNGNCVQDPSEPGLPGLYVDITPGGAVLTDSMGAYAFDVPAGTYQLDINLAPQYTDSCLNGGGYLLTVTNSLLDQDTLDFAIGLPLTQDLTVFHQYWPAVVPGNVINFGLFGQNLGNQAQAATLSWAYDSSQLQVISTIPAGATIGANLVTFPPATVIPGQTIQAQVIVQVDTTLQIGDTIHSITFMDPTTNDAYPADNVDSLSAAVLASYDPNDKQVSPVGIREAGYILAEDSVLTYTVRFQNTGTFPAQVVEIRDTLDSDLTLNSLRVMGASHDYRTEIQGDSVLVFTFPDIHLPDSASDPLGSIGFVSFRLTQQPGLDLGTEFHNRAAIYFDYNPPIITNQVLNTRFIYPVLALTAPDSICENGSFTASLSTPSVAPYLFEDAFGLSSSSNDPNLSLSAAGLSDGWYQVTVTDAFGFQATDSAFLTISPLPNAGFSSSQAPQGDSVRLSLSDQSTEAASYTWTVSGPDGTLMSEESAPSFTLGQAGTYSITQIVSNDCGSDTSTSTVLIDATSLVRSPFAGLQVRPNPFTQQTLISWGEAQNVRFTLTDLQGKILRRSTHQQIQTLRVARGELIAGVYFFALQVGDMRHVGKLILR